MTKDFKKFIIKVGDWETSNIARGIDRAKQTKASEVHILWAANIRTPAPVMCARAEYVFTRLGNIDKEQLNFDTIENGVVITRVDGLDFGAEYTISEAKSEDIISEVATFADNSETTADELDIIASNPEGIVSDTDENLAEEAQKSSDVDINSANNMSQSSSSSASYASGLAYTGPSDCY